MKLSLKNVKNTLRTVTNKKKDYNYIGDRIVNRHLRNRTRNDLIHHKYYQLET